MVVFNSFKRILNHATNRIFNLPVLVLMPHSRCNCRCVMCDIWKANDAGKELSIETLEKHMSSFRKFSVREIVFSGGEALMHRNLWALAEMLRQEGIKLTLLSTGLLLKKNAHEIVSYFDNVIVSLDGSREVHDRIRQLPKAFDKLAEGVGALKEAKTDFRVTGRCVLQAKNFKDFLHIVAAAKYLRLDQISFLAADVSSGAFNRDVPWSENHVSEIALTTSEVREFRAILHSSFELLAADYSQQFIAEHPAKMLRMADYYDAIRGNGEYPRATCNAPWVSAVIESDGNVLPCFFHASIGNIYQHPFEEIINSERAIEFRKNLDVSNNSVCKKCVCSLKLGIGELT